MRLHDVRDERLEVVSIPLGCPVLGHHREQTVRRRPVRERRPVERLLDIYLCERVCFDTEWLETGQRGKDDRWICIDSHRSRGSSGPPLSLVSQIVPGNDHRDSSQERNATRYACVCQGRRVDARKARQLTRSPSKVPCSSATRRKSAAPTADGTSASSHASGANASHARPEPAFFFQKDTSTRGFVCLYRHLDLVDRRSFQRTRSRGFFLETLSIGTLEPRKTRSPPHSEKEKKKTKGNSNVVCGRESRVPVGSAASHLAAHAASNEKRAASSSLTPDDDCDTGAVCDKNASSAAAHLRASRGNKLRDATASPAAFDEATGERGAARVGVIVRAARRASRSSSSPSSPAASGLSQRRLGDSDFFFAGDW